MPPTAVGAGTPPVEACGKLAAPMASQKKGRVPPAAQKAVGAPPAVVDDGPPIMAICRKGPTRRLKRPQRQWTLKSPLGELTRGRRHLCPPTRRWSSWWLPRRRLGRSR